MKDFMKLTTMTLITIVIVAFAICMLFNIRDIPRRIINIVGLLFGCTYLSIMPEILEVAAPGILGVSISFKQRLKNYLLFIEVIIATIGQGISVYLLNKDAVPWWVYPLCFILIIVAVFSDKIKFNKKIK